MSCSGSVTTIEIIKKNEASDGASVNIYPTIVLRIRKKIVCLLKVRASPLPPTTSQLFLVHSNIYYITEETSIKMCILLAFAILFAEPQWVVRVISNKTVCEAIAAVALAGKLKQQPVAILYSPLGKQRIQAEKEIVLKHVLLAVSC